MSELRRKAFEPIEVRAVGERRMRFVISDGTVDRENDTIDPNGWDLSSYKRNPVVLWAHDHRGLPIGKALDVRVEDGKLVAVAEFATHPMAETVLELYRGGFLRATSVGFRATRWAKNELRGGIDFLEQELLEFSCVPVPANSNALIAAAAAGIDTSTVRAWAKAALAADDAEDVIEIDPDDPDEIIEITETWAEQVARVAAAGVRRGLARRQPRADLLAREIGHHHAPLDEIDVSPRELARAIGEVVSAELPAMIGREVKRSILRARGRCDDLSVYRD